MQEAVAIEEGVDDAEELPALGEGKLLDLLKAVPEALVGGAAGGLEGLDAEELVGGEAKDLGEGREEVSRGVVGLALVVGDHALRDAEFGGERTLAEADAAAKLGEALSEGLALGGHGLSLHSESPDVES